MLGGNLFLVVFAPLYFVRWASRLPKLLSTILLIIASPIPVLAIPFLGFLLNFGIVGKLILIMLFVELLIAMFAAVIGFLLAARGLPITFSRTALLSITVEIEKFLDSLPKK